MHSYVRVLCIFCISSKHLFLLQVSLEMMETMVRAHKGPLSESMIKTGFPAVVHCTLHTDDNAAMQNGGECLRAFLSVALEQVIAWYDEQGESRRCKPKSSFEIPPNECISDDLKFLITSLKIVSFAC